ncbi:MBL fold metallo-hydrolase [Bacillus dakarensis]|uniref:MBL fold metallo-hydrolase n=1 Tax=Robertmurraya dakarensis TaxID=1926278 RepID=UPI0009817914|nr:MBL fold metallo-hydrolase [Bacillus dakarensis]
MIVWKDENLTLFRSVLYETISSVLVTEDCVIVVDPCWLPHEVEEIKQYVKEVIGSRPLYLLFTHSDYDHIIGYRAFPEAKVIASHAFDTKSLNDKEDIIEQIKEFDDEYYVSRNYEIDYPKVDHPIKGEEVSFSIGNTKLTFFQAPGHNDDGMLTVIEPMGIIIAGDYFSDIEFPYIYFSSYEYEKTVLKLDYILEHYPINLLVTGHGTPTRDFAEMKKRQHDSLDYIHKMREFVVEENKESIDQIIEGCKFPRNMKKFHKNNQLLFKSESK